MNYFAYAAGFAALVLIGAYKAHRYVCVNEDRANGNPEQLERDERRAGLRK